MRCLCRRLPGQEQDRYEPQGHQHGARRRAPRRRAAALGLLPVHRPARPRLDPARFDQGLAGARAALRVLGRLRRLRRDALHPPREPALRRPDDRRQRDRVLVDLRRQSADHAVDGQRRRPRSSVEQLALRGQRRVRARDAAGPGCPDGLRAPAAVAPHAGARCRCRRRTPWRPARDRGRDRRPARAGRPSARRARPHRRSRRVGRPTAPRARRRSRAQGSLDHRRRRLGLRHRLRRPGSCPVIRSQRQHPRARHGGVLQYRWAGLEGHAPRRRGEVRGRRQGDGQEGSRGDRAFLRQCVRGPGLHGRERSPDRPRRCWRPMPGPDRPW